MEGSIAFDDKFAIHRNTELESGKMDISEITYMTALIREAAIGLRTTRYCYLWSNGCRKYGNILKRLLCYYRFSHSQTTSRNKYVGYL